jgi:hypothetical protein
MPVRLDLAQIKKRIKYEASGNIKSSPHKT